MLKKLLSFILLWGIILPVGCKADVSSIAVGNVKPAITQLGASEATRTLTVYVYHHDNIVTKSVFIEKYQLSENANIQDLKDYSDSVEYTFSSDIFQVKGFEYSADLEETNFTFRTTTDYTMLEYEDVEGEAKIYFYGEDSDLIDEDNNVLFDKLIEEYTGWGVEFE